MGELWITGQEQLARISRELKNADKRVARDTKKELKASLAPMLIEMKAKAGEHSKYIPSTITVEWRFNSDTPVVRFIAKGSKMPAGKEKLPRLMEKGKKGNGQFWSHPLFGNRNYWYNQPSHPYMAPVVTTHLAQIRGTLIDGIQKGLQGIK